ncbi:MAG: hypothetical protein Q4C46_07845 [Bacillota bacterium]|nr:hypothetical protein [Bacillota bacterium]
MNRHCDSCCRHKKKRKRRTFCRNTGFIMLLFGGITVMAMFFPLKLWVIFLCMVLIICGVILLKN